MSVYFSNGNTKLDKACKVFSLPTYVCYGKGKQCKGCYARKAEYLYPPALPSRERNFKASLNTEQFIEDVTSVLSRTKKTIVRVHESGDFYSQPYLNAWFEIAKRFPHISFYAYTKKMHILDFSKIMELPNVNIINSMTPIGSNYGDMDKLEKLKDLGYFICPCGIDKDVKCMKTCFECLKKSKVCFLHH